MSVEFSPTTKIIKNLPKPNVENVRKITYMHIHIIYLELLLPSLIYVAHGRVIVHFDGNELRFLNIKYS